MAEWERNFFPKCPKIPLVYLRYLDYIFGVCPHPEEVYTLNIELHHASIKLKYDIHSEKILPGHGGFFLTTQDNGSRGLGFSNPQTLMACSGSSFHPMHTFQGIVKSQLIHFRQFHLHPPPPSSSEPSGSEDTVPASLREIIYFDCAIPEENPIRVETSIGTIFFNLKKKSISLHFLYLIHVLFLLFPFWEKCLVV